MNRSGARSSRGAGARGAARGGRTTDLRTPRLLLRPPTAADRDDVHAYASEPGFFRHVGVPADVAGAYGPGHAARHLEELEQNAAGGHPAWAVVPAGHGAVVGMVRFRPNPDGPELGYGIARAWRGRGLATEAVRAVLAHVDRAWPETVARCHAENVASLRLLERVGYRVVGRDGSFLLLRRSADGSTAPPPVPFSGGPDSPEP